MKLSEVLILEGKTYKNYWKEKEIKGKQALFFGWNDSPENFKKLMRVADPTATEDNVGQYADWLIKELKRWLKNVPMGTVKNKRLIKDIIVYIGSYIKSFHKEKENFKEKNIYNHNLSSLIKELDIISDKKATQKLKGVKTDFEFDGWKIVELKNHRQACNLASGTKWCVAMKDYPEEFHKYKKFGPLFVVVKGNRRWAITGGIKQTFIAWDEKDLHTTSRIWTKENNVPSEVKIYLYRRYKDES